MAPCPFYKCIAEDTRLKSLMLIATQQEACVCNLMEAWQLDQPKTSRHLAQLRKCGILTDQRRGKWVCYRLHPDLSAWTKEVINQSAKHNKNYFETALKKLISAQSSATNCC